MFLPNQPPPPLFHFALAGIGIGITAAVLVVEACPSFPSLFLGR